MAETDVDFVLENLKQLIDSEVGCQFSLVEKDQMACLYEELGSLRTFLKESEKNRYEHEKVKDMVTQIRDVVHEASDIIDSSLVNHILQKKLVSKIRMLSDVLEEIKSIKEAVKEIYENKLHVIRDPQVAMPSNGSSSRANAPDLEEETVVGFDYEAERIKERLTGLPQRLEAISIVGMAGLGKTTLAKRLYNDPFIVYYFYIRGWTYVSQQYLKRDLLLRILSSVVEDIDEIYKLSDEKLGEELYRCLKGNRYLIVMDDIWNIEAWNELKNYFPDDKNGSRIMFTSRHTDIALYAKPHSPSYCLRFLNEDESWDLFQQKVFRKEKCPPKLMVIGKQIAKKCQGLPLAIVVVAGLLAKTDKKQDWWKQVAKSVSSYIVSDPQQQCLDALALSYNSLPHHLKSCFLYFGAFPKDYEIPVRKLMCLWIAEGFINQIGQKTLEDVAEDHLMDLIDRNLVLVAKKSCTGGISKCRMHDLLHNLCLRKTEEENFLQTISWYNLVSSFLLPISKKQRRLSVHSPIFHYIFSKHSPQIRSFLWFSSEQSPLPPMSMSFIFRAFKLLRVLDLSAISVPIFPAQIVQLVLLRYLALQGKQLSLPTTISNLRNLETLILSQESITSIPPIIWKMEKLRHLRIAGENFIDEAPTEDGYPSVLDNLQTISQVCPSRVCQDILARTPNLRKLGFCGGFDSGNGCFWFPDLEFLHHLETLRLFNRYDLGRYRYNLQGIKFPPNLKRLTLSRTALEWKEMSVIGMLPNLEALKLEFQAFVGPQWETSDGGFRRLKFLRFYYIKIVKWDASSIHFPSLQCLVLHGCQELRGIPPELGDISTLQIIALSRCSYFAVYSARKIQERQQSIGNDWLKIFTSGYGAHNIFSSLF